MANFVEGSFAPNIFDLVDYQDQLALERWKFDGGAVVVPSQEQKNIGLWFGRLLTKTNSFGIIVVSVEPGLDLLDGHGQWFHGNTVQHMIETAPDPYVEMVDAAVTLVGSSVAAVNRLMSMYNTDVFPDTDRELEIPAPDFHANV